MSHDVVLRTARAQEAVQVAAAHVLVEQAHRLGEHAHAQQAHDVRVVELGHQRDFVLEVELHLVGRVLPQHLDGDERPLLVVAQSRHLRLEDAAERAAPDVSHEHDVVARELQLLETRVRFPRDRLALVEADVRRQPVDVNVQVVRSRGDVVDVLVLQVEAS